MKTLYKFRLDCGRMGYIESVFVEDDEIIKASLGKEIHFGEILGKHSEIFCNLSDSHLTVLSQDSNVCDIIETHVGATGHCPMDYLNE